MVRIQLRRNTAADFAAQSQRAIGDPFERVGVENNGGFGQLPGALKISISKTGTIGATIRIMFWHNPAGALRLLSDRMFILSRAERRPRIRI